MKLETYEFYLIDGEGPQGTIKATSYKKAFLLAEQLLGEHACGRLDYVKKVKPEIVQCHVRTNWNYC